MIAKLADSGDQDEVIRLKADLNAAKRELEAERLSSSAEMVKLRAELREANNAIAVHIDLKLLLTDFQNSLKSGDKEKEAMEQEIDNLQQQLSIKTASLQSLMLVKMNSSEADQLNEENESLKMKVNDLQEKLVVSLKEVERKTAEIYKLQEWV